MKKRSCTRQTGFTLLEVLVALVIMVIAMTALWKGLAQGIAVSQGLPDRVIARWVAQNRITMRQVMGEWPDTRAYSGSEQMGGQTWYWQEQIAETSQTQMRSITVSVGKDESAMLVSLQGFLQNPETRSVSFENATDDRGRG